jgi:hypothetical protein
MPHYASKNEKYLEISEDMTSSPFSDFRDKQRKFKENNHDLDADL